jgi:predicted metal-dependent enzyme (double-stranded beta helix superfamily)
MFSTEQLIADCQNALKDPSPDHAIKEIVRQAVSNPAQVERALGVPQKAEIISLYRSQELTVLNVIWAPGMSIYPHDHRMWAVIGLYGGREDNYFYRREPQGIVKASAKQLDTSDTVLLGAPTVHSVTNPLNQFTGAIHIYGGDFFAVPRSEFDAETLEERPYDVEKAKRVFLEANERLRPVSVTQA